MAGKIAQNGGISGLYALAVIGGSLILASTVLREKPAPKLKPRKARNKLSKIQSAVEKRRQR